MSGITQKKLGELSSTSEITIRQYELGKRQPRLEQLRKIADALGTTISELTGVDVSCDGDGKLKGAVGYEEAMKDFLEINPETPAEALKRYAEKLNYEGLKQVASYAQSLSKVPEYQAAENGEKEKGV